MLNDYTCIKLKNHPGKQIFTSIGRNIFPTNNLERKIKAGTIRKLEKSMQEKTKVPKVIKEGGYFIKFSRGNYVQEKRKSYEG